MSDFVSASASTLTLSTTGSRGQPAQADNFFGKAEIFSRNNGNLCSTNDRTLCNIDSVGIMSEAEAGCSKEWLRVCTLVRGPAENWAMSSGPTLMLGIYRLREDLRQVTNEEVQKADCPDPTMLRGQTIESP